MPIKQYKSCKYLLQTYLYFKIASRMVATIANEVRSALKAWRSQEVLGPLVQLKNKNATLSYKLGQRNMLLLWTYTKGVKLRILSRICLIWKLWCLPEIANLPWTCTTGIWCMSWSTENGFYGRAQTGEGQVILTYEST